jgi:hypothetical protein
VVIAGECFGTFSINMNGTKLTFSETEGGGLDRLWEALDATV